MSRAYRGVLAAGKNLRDGFGNRWLLSHAQHTHVLRQDYGGCFKRCGPGRRVNELMSKESVVVTGIWLPEMSAYGDRVSHVGEHSGLRRSC